MSQANYVPSADPHRPAPTKIGEAASVTPLDDVRCALCGASLVGKRERYRMVSPLVTMGKVTVCRTCHRPALSEGYRPAE
jgi:hypothetical protein